MHRSVYHSLKIFSNQFILYILYHRMSIVNAALKTITIL